MYFWNIKKLKAQLIERPLTEKEALPYVVATALIYTVLIELLSYSTTSEEAIPYGILDYISSVFAVAITIVGTIWLFKKNKVNSENYFLQRYTALGWVALMRIIVFTIFAMILIFITFLLAGLAGVLNWEPPDSHISIFLIDFLFYLFYYWYFGKQIAEVAQKATYH